MLLHAAQPHFLLAIMQDSVHRLVRVYILVLAMGKDINILFDPFACAYLLEFLVLTSNQCLIKLLCPACALANGWFLMLNHGLSFDHLFESIEIHLSLEQNLSVNLVAIMLILVDVSPIDADIT